MTNLLTKTNHAVGSADIDSLAKAKQGTMVVDKCLSNSLINTKRFKNLAFPGNR